MALRDNTEFLDYMKQKMKSEIVNVSPMLAGPDAEEMATRIVRYMDWDTTEALSKGFAWFVSEYLDISNYPVK